MTGPIRLHLQTAIVTGGGRGLDRAFALALAEAGCTVAVIARSAGELAETVALIEQAGGRARDWVCDVTDADAVARTFTEIESSFCATDLLVNNAGVLGPPGPVRGQQR
jgi:NAD(P)-dependent dehydrogenase (short-subunit alcohol dehydrogenase family)